MKFQLIHKFNLTRLLIAARCWGRPAFFKPRTPSDSGLTPNATESNSSWPQNA